MLKFVKKIYQSSNKMVFYLLICLVILVILDGVLTQYLVPNGIGTEGNPFIASLVGEPIFIILKVVGALICAVILWDIHKRFLRVGMITSWIAVIGYSGIVIWNASLMTLA
jgi:hypothetical protein